MTEENCLQVDLERVIRDKNPSLARWLPRPLLSYLKRTIHQDEINRILKSYSHLDPIGFIRAPLADMRSGYRSQGLDRLPADGRYLFVSNHPFGGMDGMMLCAELSTRFSEVRIIVNDLLMNLRPLAPLFVPVNKHGRQNARYAQTLRDTLESNAQIATFPAGLCSRRHHGRVADPRWKHSFVKNALESRRDIEEADRLPVDYLLLDTYTKHAYGGSGKTFDWSLIGNINHLYFLAGGLNESNIERAAQTGAYALDLSSGIETDDRKDSDKMRRIAALVKGANR